MSLLAFISYPSRCCLSQLILFFIESYVAVARPCRLSEFYPNMALC